MIIFLYVAILSDREKILKYIFAGIIQNIHVKVFDFGLF